MPSRWIRMLIRVIPFVLGTQALALELLAPPPDAQVAQSRVVVIGTASGADRGQVEWGGKTTAFRIHDGRFHITLDLGPGTHTVRFAASNDELTAHWEVVGEAVDGAYVYHRKVGSEECQDCHEPRLPPTPGTDVSAICNTCHPPYTQRRHIHGPVGMGLCSVCHDPHGSTRPWFLRLDTADLCTYCHNQPVTQEHSKRAGDRPCLDCHDPHGASQDYNLRSSSGGTQ